MGKLTIELPFFCEPIPDADRFDGLVGNGFVVGTEGLISSVRIDDVRAADTELSQCWLTPIGIAQNDERLRDMINQNDIDLSKIGLTMAEYFDKEKKRSFPSIKLVIILPDPYPQEISWFWDGEGTYEGHLAREPLSDSNLVVPEA